MKICMYAISKDEIKNVDAWYESVKEADHIIVLDTGSTDGTPERLEELGVEVHRKTYPKPFRFDIARNDSVELAYATDCDIFITTDFDERLSPGWSDLLKSNWIQGKHTRASYDDFYGDSNIPGSLNWIHSRDWYWKFPCHEVMVRGGSKWYLYDEELDLSGQMVLRHYQDTTKDRGQYLPLLKIRFEENPDDVDSWGYYLRELMYAGLWDEMLALEPAARAKDFPNGVEWAWTLIWIAAAYEQTGDTVNAQKLLMESIHVDHQFRTPYVSLARLLSLEGKHAMAEGVLKQALIDTERTTRSVFLDDDDVWTWRLYDWLCVVCYWQGKYEEALKWSMKAFDSDQNNDAVKHNLRACIEAIGRN